MDALNQAFEDRLEEIEAYLALLEALERQVQKGTPMIGGVTTTGGTTITTQQQRILYSCVYLQLYNLVEATVTWCLDAVCAAATEQNRWSPGDLSDKLRREWVRSTARTHIDMNPEKRLNAAVEMCDLLIQALPHLKLTVERRGDWDDVAIQDITDRLGCVLQISHGVRSGIKQRIRDDKGPLVLIKDLRNKLAHGSLSFAECGDGVTVRDLKDLKDRTAGYLREVVAAFREYIDTYQFLAPQRRPMSGI